MDFKNKLTSIEFFNIKLPQMRAFHITWISFFVCFLAWFGIAPLMASDKSTGYVGVIESLKLTPDQVANSIILSVSGTIFARLLIGPMCTRFGARTMYGMLLIIGSIPVATIGLSQTAMHFYIFRILIGFIGASFVITQYHTSVMFAPNVVGTANAITAGWGNLGGGVTQFFMPICLTLVLAIGANEIGGWRWAMVVPGILLFLCGVLYYFGTQDAPDGNYDELRAKGEMPPAKDTSGTFGEAIRDKRVWILFVMYAICFGVELTMAGTLALYFKEKYEMSLTAAGFAASAFGLMNLFARALGGYFSDKLNKDGGLKSRVHFLFGTLLIEGICLLLFAYFGGGSLAVGLIFLVTFSLFVQMAEGATYGVVPYINKRALGAVAGIVGAGGNFGAMLFGFMFKPKIPILNIQVQSAEELAANPSEIYRKAYTVIGYVVVAISFLAFAIKFSEAEELAAKKETADRLAAAGN